LAVEVPLAFFSGGKAETDAKESKVEEEGEEGAICITRSVMARNFP
jgi:hypothetical protein